MSFTALLNQTCTLRRQSNRADDAYSTETWADNGTVRCRLVKSTRTLWKEINTFERATISDLVVMLPIGTDVIEEDQAVIGATTYNITGIYSAAGHHLECGVELVT